MVSLAFWTWPLRLAAAILMVVGWITSRRVRHACDKACDDVVSQARDTMHEAARRARAATDNWHTVSGHKAEVEAFAAMVEAGFAYAEAEARLERLHRQSESYTP